MALAIVILNYNTKDMLKKCLDSIFDKLWKTDFEVWVVDNGSSDGSVKFIKQKFPKINLIESEKNLGFAGGNNLALRKIKADYFLLLNSDTEVKAGSIDNLMESAVSSSYQIVSCKLINKDGSFQPNAGELPMGFALFSWISGLDDLVPVVRNFLPSFHRKSKSYYKNGREVGWVSGSVMLVKKEVFKKVGLLDEGIFMYGEDVEFCLRAKKAGYKVGWTDQATILHLGGGSSKKPQERQWTGEFKGLLYIYGKYFGKANKMILKLNILVFTILRIIAFSIIGKGEVAKTYAKVLRSI